MKDYLLYWINRAKAGKLADRTLYDYRQIVALHFNGKIGKVELAKLRPMQIQDFYQTLAHYSLSLRRQVHNVLRPALRQAVNWGLIDNNPCDQGRGPPSETQREEEHHSCDDQGASPAVLGRR